MKKILTALIAMAILTASLSGCVGSARNDSINEIGSSYQADEYYEEQQKEIDDIIAEYTEKINNASNKSEVKKLKDECLQKINDVDKKDEALVNAKDNAEKFFESVKGTILTHKASIDYIKVLTDSYNAAETPAEINSAIDALKDIVGESSASITINCNTFNITLRYFENSEGIPMIEAKCSSKWSEAELPAHAYFQLQISSSPSSKIESLDTPRLLSYQSLMLIPRNEISTYNSAYGIRINDGFMYFDDAGLKPSANPEAGRFSHIDDYTVQAQVMSKEQFDLFNSDSETFTNSDGEEVARTDSGNYIADFVSISIGGSEFTADEDTKYNNIALYRVIL